MATGQVKKSHYGFWFGVIGFIVGLVVVVIATWLTLTMDNLPLELYNIIQAHLNNPLLWLIDTLPFILAIMAGMIGSRESAAQESQFKYMQVARAYQNRTERFKEKEAEWQLQQNEWQAQIGQEVEARKEIEMNLAETEQEYYETEKVISKGKREWEATFDAVKDLVLVADTHDEVVRCNMATSIALGVDFPEIIGKPIRELLLGDDAYIEAFPVPGSEATFPVLEGWYEIASHDVMLEAGKSGKIYILRDITERVQATHALQRQMQYYEALVENLPVALVTMKLDNTIVDCNPAFVQLFGYAREEIQGAPLYPLIALPSDLEESRTLVEVTASDDVVSEVGQRKHRDGSVLDVEVYGIPVILWGKQIGVLGIYHDLSRLPQIKEARMEALETEALFDRVQAEVDKEIAAKERNVITATMAGMVAAETIRASQEKPDIEDIVQEEVVEELTVESSTDVEVEQEYEASIPPFLQDFMTEEAEPDLLEAIAVDEGLELDAEQAESSLEESEAVAETPVHATGPLPVRKIEGIGPVYAEKLAEVGIQNTHDLLAASADRKSRDELSRKTSISPTLILGWTNRADLMRVPGIGEEYSDLLENAGVDTVKELAHRNPENLHQKLNEVNDEKNLVRRTPNLAEVTRWVEAAKELDPLITY
jgi:PAS domain S-box-containing protein